jgi:hypothetical protein
MAFTPSEKMVLENETVTDLTNDEILNNVDTSFQSSTITSPKSSIFPQSPLPALFHNSSRNLHSNVNSQNSRHITAESTQVTMESCQKVISTTNYNIESLSTLPIDSREGSHGCQHLDETLTDVSDAVRKTACASLPPMNNPPNPLWSRVS